MPWISRQLAVAFVTLEKDSKKPSLVNWRAGHVVSGLAILAKEWERFEGKGMKALKGCGVREVRRPDLENYRGEFTK